MDISSSSYSDPSPFGSDIKSSDIPTPSPSRRGVHSDGEVILAASRPKKRAGRKKFKETRHPVYRGIRQRNTDKWVCEVREPNKKSRLWLGTYPTAEMAARAHDVAALALRGQSACLNFEDSVWRLPVPASKDSKDIRSAAVEAAEAFRPSEITGVDSVNEGESSNGSERASDNVKELEVIFEMKELVLDIADGPLHSPPQNCFGGGFGWDDLASDIEVSLWSHSI